MFCKRCGYETDRLRVGEWHSLGSGHGDLSAVTAEMLSPAVTRELPVEWQGAYSVERARRWIRERDAEGPTLLVVEKASGKAVGLVILFEGEEEDGSLEVRLGYLLAEQAWGKGLATEVVSGFVRWCRAQTAISSVAAGVSEDNPASIRVLEKAGFVSSEEESEKGQLTYVVTTTL